MSKIFSSQELQEHLKKTKGNQILVFTNGCFDLLHIGHIRYLKEAGALGDLLVVGLNSDESVSRLKGPSRPIQTEEDRAEILASLESVDYVTVFSEDTPLNLIQALKPDILVKGGDWKEESIIGSQFVTSYGGKVQSLHFIQGASSTQLIRKIFKINKKED